MLWRFASAIRLMPEHDATHPGHLGLFLTVAAWAEKTCGRHSSIPGEVHRLLLCKWGLSLTLQVVNRNIAKITLGESSAGRRWRLVHFHAQTLGTFGLSTFISSREWGLAVWEDLAYREYSQPSLRFAMR